MCAAKTLEEAVPELLRELLTDFDAKVPSCGEFPDFVVTQKVSHVSALNGSESLVVLEFAVRAMNPEQQREFDTLRFLAIRARSLGSGGFVSTTLYHGEKNTLRGTLVRLSQDPTALIETVAALLEGLPEESDPALWR